MKLPVVTLRVLLVLIAVTLLAAYAVLFVVSGDLAVTYSSVGHLRLPLFGVALGAGVPVAVTLWALWRFASLAAQGEAFSARTLGLLRVLRTCFAGEAVYLLVGFVATSVALAPEQSPTLFLAWCASEVLAVFLLALTAVMVRVADEAPSMRRGIALSV